MRHLLHVFLALTIIFSPISPVLGDEPQAPSNPNEDQGDFVTLPQMQAGQAQTQDNLTRAATLQNQLAAQAASPEVSFDQRPTYSAQIGVNDDFSARFQLTNSSPVIRNGYVMIGFTPSGTTNTREFYRPISMPPGTTIRDIVITNAQLRAGGVTPGNYQLSFLAYNEQDQKIGSGFFGNPFSFGSALPAIGAAPTYSLQINTGGNIVSTWTFSNSGDVPATVTLLTVVTPAGTTNSQEFYRTGVSIPAGGGTAQQTVAASQLSAAGFGAGRYLLSFVAFDAAERRIGEFFGKPLTIGSVDVHVAAPSIPSQIGADSDLTVDFETTNGGNFSDPLTALLAFTPVGSTDPAETIEIYVSGFNADPGSASHRIFRTAQQLRDRGINPGRWLVTMTAFNAQDQRLESYYGHLLTIGDIRVTLPTQPVLPSSIGASGDYSADFTFVNNGDTADKATALLVLTPVGATDPSQSKEFYFTRLVTPPGSSTHTVTITAAQLANAGITPGNWLVTATGFDGAGVRLQNYFGNPLEIGNVEPSFTVVPTYRRQIPANGDFLATFQIGNAGDTPGRVTLVTSITPAGSTDPAATKEFSLQVTVPPGGGLFDFEILNSALVAAGIQPGDQVVSFVVLDAAGNRVGEFFGNLLRIGESSLTVPAVPVYSNRVGSSEDFTTQWTFGNSGSVSADVQVLTVFTKVGTTNSIEVYRDGLVPANGGGTVNVLLTAADRAATGITAGDYTLSFVAFDANGNRIAEFFGNPLAIGESAVTLPAVPSYTNAIGLGDDLASSWNLGNSGSASGTATLVVSVTPVGGTDSDTVEFRKVVSIPAGGETVSFVVTNAELDTAGITGGRYLTSFVAFDPSGTRLGQFFGNALTVGTIEPSFTQTPAYTNSIGTSSPFESDWTLGNTGDAPDRMTLVIAITPAGATDPSQTKEFSKVVSLPAGGGSFDFDITAQQLSDAGIRAGNYTVTFAAINGAGSRVGQFFGNPLEVIPGGTSGAFLLGQQLSTGNHRGLLETWDVAPSDPLFSDLADRAFTYDQALASVAFLYQGQIEAARAVLDALAGEENGTGKLGFVYRTGPQGADFLAVFSGTVAWVGDALANYQFLTGDTRYLSFAERLAQTLLSFKDPATGLIRGGLTADGNPYPWISTEHNMDTYSFFDDLAFVTGSAQWRQEADALGTAIDTQLWAGTHFLNGFGDDLVSLDTQAFGGIYLASRGDIARATTLRVFIEENLKTTVDVNGIPVTAYVPYRGDSFIWVEGSLFVAFFDAILGEYASARAIADGLENLRASSGGLLYSSSTSASSAPGADGAFFPAQPHVAPTAFSVILQVVLDAAPATASSVSTAQSFSPLAMTQPSFDAASVTVSPIVSSSVTASVTSASSVFLPPTQGGTKTPMSLYSQAAQQGFFNIAPGMFRLAYLSSGKRSDLSQDSFFSFLLEFLFG